MAGRGAWPFYYQYGLDRRNDPTGRDAHGIRAFKRELIFNGFASGIVADLPYWGKQADQQLRAFQQAASLTVDGQLGPKTAAALLRKRAKALENRYGIPDNYLCKLKTLESNNDPIAEGYADPDDEGLVQINLDYHPSVSEDEAWDPAFCLEWAAKYLKDAVSYIYVKSGHTDWDGAIVSYNIGRYQAAQWVNAGKPASDGPLIGGQDGWARATKYLSLVSGAAC